MAYMEICEAIMLGTGHESEAIITESSVAILPAHIAPRPCFDSSQAIHFSEFEQDRLWKTRL